MPEIIPVSATVHYKAAFEIICAAPEPMTYIRRLVRQWCARKTQCADDLLGRKWFMGGNNPTSEPAHYLINDHQLRTAVAQGSDPREPNCWALEIVHPDAEETHRRWSVDVILRRTDSQRIKLTTVVRNWMVANFIGEYPSPPSASVPGYVTALVGDSSLQCVKGSTALRPRFALIRSEDALAFYEELKSDERFVPFVVMSYHPPTGGPLLDPTRVASSLVGNANVFVLASDSVNDELNYHLGHPYDLASGTVRVFFPGLHKSDPYDPKRHRYLSESFILDKGTDIIMRYLTNGLCRNASSFRLNDLTSFSDVLAERRKQHIAFLATEKKALASQTHELSATEAMLWEEIEDLSRKSSEWETQASQLDAEVATLRKENGTLSMRIRESERVRSRIEDLTAQAEGLKSLATLPTALDQVLAAVGKLYPSRIVITDRAIASARDHASAHSHWDRAENLSIAWSMVYALAEHLHRLAYDENTPNFEADFNSAVAGFSLAMTETGQTRKDGTLMALRRLEWQGHSWDITPHLKYGTRLPRLLRLHFAFDNASRRFIIGHFGDHLDTSSTRRLS